MSTRIFLYETFIRDQTIDEVLILSRVSITEETQRRTYRNIVESPELDGTEQTLAHEIIFDWILAKVHRFV